MVVVVSVLSHLDGSRGIDGMTEQPDDGSGKWLIMQTGQAACIGVRVHLSECFCFLQSVNDQAHGCQSRADK
jgi:hypothetical protein